MNLPRPLTLLLVVALLWQPIFPVMASGTVTSSRPAETIKQLPEPISIESPASKPTTDAAYSPVSFKSGGEVAPQSTVPVPAPQATLQAAVATANGLIFIENVGQFDPPARFLMRSGKGSLFLTDDALWLTVLEQPQEPLTPTLALDNQRAANKDQARKGVNLKLSFAGANPHPRLEPFDRLDTHVSYFTGNDPAKWQSDVPVWGGVRYVDLYPGIDLELTSDQGQLQQRLVVRDSAHLSQVHLKVDGAESVATHRSANRTALQLTTAIGAVNVPLFEVVGVISTDSLSLPAIQGNVVAAPFANAPLMRAPGLQSPVWNGLASPLAITNTSDLRYATYLGGNGNDDFGYGIALDSQGGIYVTGYTKASSFPTTSGAFNTTFTGLSDAFVTKIGASGAISYSTFLGGSGTSIAWGIAVDSAGDAYVTGYTTATFPISITGQVVMSSVVGTDDVFVTKLNPTGTGLIYSTLLGGSGSDRAYGIALDATGAAYIAGHTDSPNFPRAGNALQVSYSPSSGYAFLSKLTAAGSLIYSTYLGGEGQTIAYGVAVDSNGSAYLTGNTNVNDLGTNNTTNAGGSDVFVAKLDASGSGGLTYFTYLGGTAFESAYGVAVDSTGAAYIAGWTQSISTQSGDQSGAFPTTPNAYITNAEVLADLCSNYIYPHGFAAKLAPDGGYFLYSTFLHKLHQGPEHYPNCLDFSGGIDPDAGKRYAVAVDANQNAYITAGGSINTTPGAYSSSGAGFIAKVGYSGDFLEYASRIPSTKSLFNYPHTPYEYENSGGSAIAVTAEGVAYVTGQTYMGFPTSPGAAQPNYGGGYLDAFVMGVRTDSLTKSRIFWKASCPLCSVFNSRNHRGGPIDTLTGNYTYAKADENIPVLGGTLSFEHSYISEASSLYTRTLGYGWTHNQEIRLVFPTDPGGVSGQVQLQAPGGAQLPFFDLGNGSYQSYPGVTANMSRIMATGGITTYVVTATNQTVYTFNAAGLITQSVNPAGNVISYTYYLTGPLQSVQSYGRALRFSYDTQKRLTTVLDPISRTTQFIYGTNGDLVNVIDTRGLTWTYQYSGTTHLLSRILDPDQKTVERTIFDGQRRAIQQYNGKDDLIVKLDFGPGGVITATDGLTRTAIDRYGQGTWLGGIDAATQAITRTYDANFKATYVADANGNGPQMQWSLDGANLEKITYAPGVSITQKFDTLNNLTRTVDARGFATVFTYTGSFLTRKTDALTNTWIYTPTSDGRNMLAAELAPGSRLTTYQYDPLGQRIAMTDALTNVTRYGYDSIGRLISTTVYAGQPAYERTTLNRYDGAGNLISTTVNFNPAANADPRLYNLTTLYGYDGAGRQIAITDTIGRLTRNYYNGAGQLVSTTANFTDTPGVDPNLYNLTTWYGYDQVGNRILVTDTRHLVTKTEFDNLNRPITVTTNYVNGVYDPARPDEDLVHVTHYDPAGNVIEQIEMSVNGALDRVTRTQYDTLNRPITVTRNFVDGVYSDAQPDLDLTTVTTYDAAGNAVQSLDPLQHPAWFRYDELNRLISTTNALSGTTLTQYDAVGNRLLVTDVLTRATRYEYDTFGNRLITTTFPYTGWVVNTYDPAGNRTRVTDALGHGTVYTYNLRGQLIAETDAMSGTTRYEYDRIGNRVAITNAQGSVTHYDFDIAGHMLVMTQSYTTTLGLDPNTYNLVTRYRYDKVGNVISMTNPLTAATVYTYDALSRLIGQSDGLSRAWDYQYDALGNRAVFTDANRLVTRFEFDKANRLTAVFYPTDTIRYRYDAVGNRKVMTDAIGVTTFRYDALNRLTSHTDPLQQIITNTYDAYGNVIGLRYPDGKVVTYTYNTNNWLTGVRDWSGRVITYTYDRVGHVITQELPNRIITAYRYDDANRLIGLTTRNAGWTLGAYTYTLDALGNRTRAEEYVSDLSFVDYLPLITNNYSDTQGLVPQGSPNSTFISPLPLPSGGSGTLTSPLPTPLPVVSSQPSAVSNFPNALATTFTSPLPPPASCPGGLPTFGSTTIITYTYDLLSRVTDAFYSSGACFRYNYDAGGNVTWSEETVTSTHIITYAYDITSRLQTSKVDVESTMWYYRFDNNGNLVEMTPNGSAPANGAIRYTYNGANQLNKIETHNGSAYVTLAQMAYDGIGSRVVLTGWVSGVAYTTTYASRIAGKVQILQATSGANATSYLYGLNQIGEFGSQSVYYLTDGVGSIRHLVDPNGAVKLARMYEPFGQVLAQTGTGDPIYGYLGAQYDRISGLLYINGRYYDPVTGRFLSPSNGGSNPYIPLGGAALAPILILALIGRRKKGKIWVGWVIVALMMSASLTLVGCNMPDPQQDDNNDSTPITETNPDPTGTATPVPTPSATPVPPTATPLPPPTATCPSTSTSTPALGNLPRRWFIAEDHNKPDNPKVQNEQDDGWTCSPIALFILLRNVGAESDSNKVIKAVDDIPPSQGGLSHHYKERKCKLDNPVCTSLKVIEKVAREDYAGPHCLTVDAREGWTKEEIMGYIARDIPVMVNYGGGVEGLVGHSIVAYGYDLDVGIEGTFWFLDPMTNSIKPWSWKDFNPLWNASDYGDPLKENTDGTYDTYYNWAMAIYK